MTDDSIRNLIPELPIPWSEPVDGAVLLDELSQTFRRFLFLPPGADDVLALWSVHTYAYEAADYFPILSAISPQKRCGKSTLLRLLRALVRQPVMASHFRVAVIYRIIEASRPTLLIDEADTYLLSNKILIGVLNSG